MKTVRLMRHSTTIDGKNDVKNGKRATALAILAGAFSDERSYVRAISSPMQRAKETGELVLQFMGLDLQIEEDSSFAGGPPEIVALIKSEDFLKLQKEKGWTLEETLFSGLAGDVLNNFVTARGIDGFARLQQIVSDLKPQESAIVFTHSGSQIEPIATAAIRMLYGRSFDDPFTFSELPGGMCWETESYVIEFNDDNSLHNVYKRGYDDTTVVELIKKAKQERI